MDTLDHLSSLLPDIVSPLGVILGLLLLALLLRKHNRWPSLLTLSALLILILCSLPYTSMKLISTLENRYPPVPVVAVPTTDVAVLLGGSVNLPMTGMQRAELGPSGDRLALTAALYKAGKIQRILISAGNTTRPAHLEPEAEYTARILAEWGIPRSAMILESDSGNTYENALFTKKLLRTEHNSSILLITSALHMPRARALFCHAGLSVTGITANHWNSTNVTITASNWFPQAVSFRGTSRVIREYMGIIAYAMAGKLDHKALRHNQPCSHNQF